MPEPVSPTVIHSSDIIGEIGARGVARTESERTFDQEFRSTSSDAAQDYAKLVGLRDHFNHKRYWSWFLMGAMGIMITFQSVLITMVGTKMWDFTGYDWLLPTLMIQYLIQIVGLAVFVVKSLFNRMD